MRREAKPDVRPSGPFLESSGPSMGYYPLFLEIQDMPCIVVGGGAVALRKAQGLLKAGARVTVISPEVTENMEELVHNEKVALVRRPFEAGDLKGAGLVIAASSERAVNEEVSREARTGSVPVNVVDDPSGSAFIVPSTIRRGPLSVAISTAGKCPALSRRTRLELEKVIGPEYGPYLEIIGAIREKLLKSGVKGDKKDRIINELLDSEMLVCLRLRDVKGVERVLKDVAGETLAGLGLNHEKVFSSLRGDGC
ncbi:MAG: bifunctional precorrin-2 dehydrogenase/sirohydrochlorin ferrochelatase [Thermodesulfobacteriota bacterium]